MTADFDWQEHNGAGPSITGSIANINFGSTDSADLVALSYPITAGNYSYEKYISGSFGGTFTKIDNVQFWKSAGNYVTGETIFWTGSETGYTQPVATKSSSAVGSVPTSDPGTANVSIHGSLTGSLIAIGSTDFVVLQLETTASTPAGAVNQKTFTLNYDEVWLKSSNNLF